MAPNSISEHLFSKFSWGMPPEPLTLEYLAKILIVLHSIGTVCTSPLNIARSLGVAFHTFKVVHSMYVEGFAWTMWNCFLHPWVRAKVSSIILWKSSTQRKSLNHTSTCNYLRMYIAMLHIFILGYVSLMNKLIFYYPKTMAPNE